MNIIPVPQELNKIRGKFRLKMSLSVDISHETTNDVLYAVDKFKKSLDKKNIEIKYAKRLKRNFKGDIRILQLEEIHELCGVDNKEEGYVLEVKEDYIEIRAFSNKGIFYGLGTLTQIIQQSEASIECLKIIDYPQFKVRGFYHDITRGKVPTLKKLKEIVDDISKYKLNQFQLYVEHVFPFTGHDEIYKETDVITPEEILELDKYCLDNHVEMIPSMATFGHLYHLLGSEKYGHLCEKYHSKGKKFSWVDRMRHHTIDISNPESLTVIEKMIEDYLPLFSSDKFNICCDETFDLGTERSKEYVQDKGRGEAYLQFLNKIIEVVKKQGKTPMFWGDIILKYPQLLDQIDQNVICLNWNYSSEATDESTKVLSESGRKFYNCPGVWGWDRFMNDIKGSFENIKRMVQYGEKHGAEGILNTDWGDYGHTNFYSSSKPGMILGAALSWNNKKTDLNKEISFAEFGDTEIVDLLKELGEQHYVCLMEIVWWMESRIKATSLLEDRPELKEKYLKNKSEKDLKKHYKKACDIKNELEEKLLNTDKKNDLKEFIIAAEGVALVNSLFLHVKEGDMKEKVDKQIHNKEELASIIEKWVETFKKAWRRDNKESELGRINDFFKEVCIFLRK